VDQYFRTRLNETDTNDLSCRFSKDDLRNAKIINQVDRKFIACLFEDDSEDRNGFVGGRALVFIDQHAADERVRVESFLRELCQGFLYWDTEKADSLRTRQLSPAMSVLLTRREALQLGRSDDNQLAFRSWGFRFGDLSQISQCDSGDCIDDANSRYVQVFVESIPEIVSDKVCFYPCCVLLPDRYLLRPAIDWR
jgi:DNA mismatch repair protein MLH3